MLFHTQHTIRYRYSQPVFLEPLTVRLRPRSDATQRVIHFELRVDPEPDWHTENLDLEAGSFTTLIHHGLQTALTIEAHSNTETLRTNPFDCHLTVSKFQGRFEYPPDLADQLVEHRRRHADGGESDRFLSKVMSPGEWDTFDFLAKLNALVHGRIRRIQRPEGSPQPPDETLRRGTGACRDSAVLFMDLCRAVGFAARFVTGYHEGDPETPEAELHAWAEVFLPGAGWRGFDPTVGLAVADRHMVLAAAARPEDTAPVQGTFRGTGATSEMEFEVKLRLESRG